MVSVEKTGLNAFKSPKFWLYLIVCLAPLIIVNRVSDLPIWIGNGEAKAREILNFQLPTDNFYPIGKALMLLPFVWLTPKFFPVIVFYFLLSAVIYYFICELIPNRTFRYICLAALPANPYLIWLCYSSQDTVFELFLLLLLTFSALANKHLIFITAGFLLCLTRPSYWVIFFGLAFFLLVKGKRNKVLNSLPVTSNKCVFQFICLWIFFPCWRKWHHGFLFLQ